MKPKNLSEIKIAFGIHFDNEKLSIVKKFFVCHKVFPRVGTNSVITYKEYSMNSSDTSLWRLC